MHWCAQNRALERLGTLHGAADAADCSVSVPGVLCAGPSCSRPSDDVPVTSLARRTSSSVIRSAWSHCSSIPHVPAPARLLRDARMQACAPPPTRPLVARRGAHSSLLHAPCTHGRTLECHCWSASSQPAASVSARLRFMSMSDPGSATGSGFLAHGCRRLLEHTT